MAQRVKEIQFTVPNKIGVLAVVASVLKAAKVNIVHATAWSEGSKGFFSLVTNNNARAKRALAQVGIRAKDGDVVVLKLKNKVGALANAARRLAKANVNITCLSATSAGARTAILIHTKNNSKAARVV